jgi:hypothetical protein
MASPPETSSSVQPQCESCGHPPPPKRPSSVGYFKQSRKFKQKRRKITYKSVRRSGQAMIPCKTKKYWNPYPASTHHDLSQVYLPEMNSRSNSMDPLSLFPLGMCVLVRSCEAISGSRGARLMSPIGSCFFSITQPLWLDAFPSLLAFLFEIDPRL